jgi:PTS system cellobiose-specific IIC component
VPSADGGPAAENPALAGARRRLQAVADFFTRQRHLVAIRDGIVGALPLVLIGSVFLLLAHPPSAVLQREVAPYSALLMVPYRMLGGLIAVYVAFAAAHSLAKSYGLDPMAAGLLAMACLFVAAVPSAEPAGELFLPVQRLGAGGIFAALAIALGTVELSRFFVSRRWTIRLPATAPEMVVRSFLALVPGFAAVLITFLIVQVLRIDLISILQSLAAPFLRATGSLPAALAVVSVDSALWLLGVHASAALGTLKPLWEAMLVQNMEAASRGVSPLPHIATLHFYLWFVWQGGSGASLPLAVLLLRARSSQLRGVGRMGIFPALCNISEPILFGVPVVLNATLAVPFFAAPLATAITSYLAFQLNWVTRPYLEVPWTLPAPAGAFFSTGGDYRALVLQLFNLALGLSVYWPFVRRYDRALCRDEAKTADRSGSPATLLRGEQSP